MAGVANQAISFDKSVLTACRQTVEVPAALWEVLLAKLPSVDAT